MKMHGRGDKSSRRVGLFYNSFFYTHEIARLRRGAGLPLDGETMHTCACGCVYGFECLNSCTFRSHSPGVVGLGCSS